MRERGFEDILHEYVAESVVFFVDCENGGIRDLGVLGVGNPTDRDRTRIAAQPTHFFSPSSSKKASNVAGAFMIYPGPSHMGRGWFAHARDFFPGSFERVCVCVVHMLWPLLGDGGNRQSQGGLLPANML